MASQRGSAVTGGGRVPASTSFLERIGYIPLVPFRGRVEIIKSVTSLILVCLLSFSGSVFAGDAVAGEKRYNESCINCHGPAGKGVASYPKISGREVSYTQSKLETYRDGIKIGPNSALMIMMAKSLTDEEIANLAAYLKDAKYEK